MIWPFLFFINLVFFLWVFPIEVYYYYPLPFSIACGSLSSFFAFKLIRFLIADDLIPEGKYSLIIIITAILTTFLSFYMYDTRMEVALSEDGVFTEATITDKYFHRKKQYIVYEYMFSGTSYNSSKPVPFNYYMNDIYNIGSPVPIIYLKESPWVSIIDLKRMIPDLEATDKFIQWQKEQSN